MNKQPAVSVIVPVYKAENYLHRCVDSLLAQTFTDFEILLIDDGSPDRSGEICDEYAAKDSRIRVFHKENGGVSSARQCGIDNAFGEYTIHVDPDDWVESEMLEVLYQKAKQEDADMVICDYFEERQGKLKYIEQKPLSLNSRAIQEELLRCKLHGSCCNKLIRQSCYYKKVYFPTEFNIREDLYFNILLLNNDLKIAYLSKAFYHYIRDVNQNSYTLNMNEKSLHDYFYMTCELYSVLCLDQNKRNSLDCLLLHSCLICIKNGAKYDRRVLYDKCFDAYNSIWSRLSFSFYNKLLLYCDYKRYKVVVIILICANKALNVLRSNLLKLVN